MTAHIIETRTLHTPRIPLRAPQSLQAELDSSFETLSSSSSVVRGHERHILLRRCLALSVEHSLLPTALSLSGIICPDTTTYCSGSFADVFVGTYKGARVALRKPHTSSSKSEEDKAKLMKWFCRESLLWSVLSHDHILPLLGVCSDIFSSSVCMVLPWMDDNLRSYLQVVRSQGNMSGRDMLLDIQTWLHHVGLGLQYLHEEGIVHGDLHGANVLIDGNRHIRLTDFGMSTIAEVVGGSYASIHGGGAAHFTAPELIDPEEMFAQEHLLADDPSQLQCRPSKRSDIFSLACLVVELYTGRPPVPYQPNTRSASTSPSEFHIKMLILRGYRAPRPTLFEGGSISDTMWSLTTSCWEQRPHLRPSIDSVVNVLATVLRNTQDDSLTDPSSSCQLPVEVWEGVIDCLNGSNASLRACSLVCHDWVHRSRLHLLSDVTISSANALSSFTQLLDTVPKSSTYVRNLSITNSGTDHSWLSLIAPLPALENLETLQLHDFNIDQLSQGLLTDTTLRLAHLIIRNVQDSKSSDISGVVANTLPVKITWEHLIPDRPIPAVRPEGSTIGVEDDLRVDSQWSLVEDLSVKASWSDLSSIFQGWRTAAFTSLATLSVVCVGPIRFSKEEDEDPCTIWHDIADMFRRACTGNSSKPISISIDLGSTNTVALRCEAIADNHRQHQCPPEPRRSLEVSISASTIPASYASQLLSCFALCGLHTIKFNLSLTGEPMSEEWKCIDRMFAEDSHILVVESRTINYLS
ncbi:kinase-like domain-containing protein [Cristinia sonorae]|uniref:Kinase-like domain-containing protein n=1 Tax=Cristinia sonorae TaxID=1940300 RepID=A0A8K0URK3_9AGAR|nr:kinase-like domain-containing protein [Cristinia sonorae]